ncbi:MAG TPA: GNAT family N-acetyltransferase [Candidatus Limnocylindrales bacterium]
MTDTPETADRYPIQTATLETVEAFVAPLNRAFADMPDPGDEERRTWEPDRIIAAFDGTEPIATAGALTFRLSVPGGETAAAGVTLVGVSPSHRRRGILRSMMRHQLDDVRARGEPIAILWASEGAIYQRFGYGLATLSGTFEIERGGAAFARPAPVEGTVRLVDLETAMGIFPPLYDRVRVETPGMVGRSETWWRWIALHDTDHMRGANGMKFLAIYEADGQVEGAAIYRVKPDWDDRGPNGRLVALEVLATTPRANRDLWRWLFEVDLVRLVRAVRGPVPHPLQLLLADPRRLGFTVGDAIWLRVVDVSAALAARTYGRAGALVLEVRDSFCPWNAGRWRLDVADDGRGSVEPSTAEPDVTLDAADLGATYLGTFRFSELARVGRVVENTAGALLRADEMFAAARAPWCSTMF